MGRHRSERRRTFGKRVYHSSVRVEIGLNEREPLTIQECLLSKFGKIKDVEYDSNGSTYTVTVFHTSFKKGCEITADDVAKRLADNSLVKYVEEV